MSTANDAENIGVDGLKINDEIESEESDLEIDREGCIEPDNIDDVEMGDSTKELSDEDVEKAQELKSQALAALSSGEFEKAISLFSQAIAIDASSAVLFTKRGQCYLKLSKPNACIRDCSKALEINPDSAAAYKFRGRAHRLIGEWEKAAQDLRQACKIDFDEQADEWLKEVTPNAKKIENHNIKKERKKLEKEEKEKLERIRQVKEARAKAAAENQNQEPDATGEGAGMGGKNSFFNLINEDPELLTALKDPEVAAAFKDIMSNPMNILKYSSNPKVSNIITKLLGKMETEGMPAGFPGGMPGGMAGGFPGGMPGFPGAGAFNAAPPQGPSPTFEDDNLD